MNLDNFLNHMEDHTNKGCRITLTSPVEYFTVEIDQITEKYLTWLESCDFVRSASYSYIKDGVVFDVKIECVTYGIEMKRIV